VLRLNRESLRQRQQMARDEIPLVLYQLAASGLRDRVSDPLIIGKPERQAASSFGRRVRALEQDADLKNLVDTVFLHRLQVCS
jgi:hypothetical protein